MEEPDPKVIRSAAAGDDAAFTTIMRAAQPHVWRFLRHMMGDEELAADVTQETFVRVHRALGGFRHQARFSTWLFHIARNAALDEQRRGARRRKLDGAIIGLRSTGDASLGAEVQAALASLSPRLREAFVLVEAFGQPYQEAAEVLGVPIGTVKSRVFRARLELVHWFTEEEASERGHGG